MGRSALAQRLPRAVLGALGEAYPPLLDGFTSFAEEDAAGGGGAASCGEVPPAAALLQLVGLPLEQRTAGTASRSPAFPAPWP